MPRGRKVDVDGFRLTPLSEASAGSLAWAKSEASKLLAKRSARTAGGFEVDLIKALRSAYAEGWRDRNSIRGQTP